MISKKNILIISFCISVLFVVVLFYGSADASTRNYDIRNEISTPEYKTDTTRAIDAYERLMDRFLDANQENLSALDNDIKQVVSTLNEIQIQLTKLSERQIRIEKALGIEPDTKPEEPKEEAKVQN